MSSPAVAAVRPRVAVYCGSRRGTDPTFAEAAHRIGAGLAERDIDLVFGGGSVGLMGVVADAALEGGSDAIGVITDHLLDREIAHRGVSEMRVVADMSARKREMYDLADAFLTLPGGVGTMEEFFEVLTWGYLGLHPKPMGILNVAGFYDPLLAFLRHTIDQGLAKSTVLNLIAVGMDESILDDLVGAQAVRLS